MKREFPFEEALHAFEVVWASTPPTYVIDQPLFDPDALYRPGALFMPPPTHDPVGAKLERTYEQSPPPRGVVKGHGRDDLTGSSGRGSLSSNSVSQPVDVPQPRSQQRPLRRIRFLPKILSTDSREIDSPDEEDMLRSKVRVTSLARHAVNCFLITVHLATEVYRHETVQHRSRRRSLGTRLARSTTRRLV